MASSGSFVTNACENRTLTFKWSVQSQDIINNKTIIAWSFVGSGSASGYVYAGSFTVVINGSTVYSSATRIPVYNGTVVASGTHSISHTAEGTKNFNASSSAAVYSYAVNVNGSGTWALPTIPRASTISSINGQTIGSNVTININRASSNFTHKVYYSWGGLSNVLIGEGVNTSCTFTPPMELCRQIPNNPSGTGSIKIETYHGTTLIGSTNTAIILHVPSSVVPSFSGIELIGVDTFKHLYLGGISKVKATVVGATGSYGSTITGYKISGQGITSTSSTATSTELPIGTFAYTAIITDSRGRTVTKTSDSITVLSYSKPTIAADIVRGMYNLVTNEFIENDIEGTTLGITPSYSYASLEGKNSITFKQASSSQLNVDLSGSGTEVYLGKPKSVGAEGEFSIDKGYTVTLLIEDEVGYQATTTVTISTGKSIIDIKSDGSAIAFGCVADESDCFNVSLSKAKFDGDVEIKGGLRIKEKSLLDFIYPVGAIYISANSANPSVLFGGTWTQLQNRFLLGAGSSYANGATGGSATHTHTSAAHAHGSGSLHAQFMFFGTTSLIMNRLTGQSSWTDNRYKTVSGGTGSSPGTNTEGVNVGGSTSSATPGATGATSTLPPYLVVYMWQRTA